MLSKNLKISYDGVRKCLYFAYRNKHSGNIDILPLHSLVADRVTISGRGYKPSSPITVFATAHNHYEKLYYFSYGQYFTSSDGTFDVGESESVGGTYSGVHGMGLFWSMKPQFAGCFDGFQMNNAGDVLHYNFCVVDGHVDDKNNDKDVICKAYHKRAYLANGVTRRKICENDVKGTLFVPSGEGPFPAIITLFGSLKGKKLVENASAMFANNGFASLALEYFGYEGLPKCYVNEPIRVEMFENAIEYLKMFPSIKSDAIGAYGVSEGGTICLAMASLLPQIKSIATVNGQAASYLTPTTYKDYIFPDAGVDVGNIATLPDGSRSVRVDFNRLVDRIPSKLPCERLEADVLSIEGLDDSIVNSEEQADFLHMKFDAAKKQNYGILRYKGLGHVVDAPFAPASTSTSRFHVLGNISKCDENMKLHDTQTLDVWDKVVNFFGTTLND